jgi:hypothetical protein
MKKTETSITKGAISAPYPKHLMASHITESISYPSHSICQPTYSFTPYSFAPTVEDNRINDVVIDYATNSAPGESLYTKEDVLIAGEIGEINHHDYKHIASLLDEARRIRLNLNR